MRARAAHHVQGAEPGVDAIRSLRALLKIAGRQLGLRAIDVCEHERACVDPSPRSHPTRELNMSAFSERVRSKESGFFKVADLEGGKELTLTIDRLDEEMEIFNEMKDVLNFRETGKQFQLNQTTSEWLLDNLGDDPETYAGKKVTLYLGEYEFKKEKKLGIRLKLPGAPAPKPPAPRSETTASGNGGGYDAAAKPSRGKDLDDEIPF
jgi:hypothetical protein